MFTGIVDHKGAVESVEEHHEGRRLWLNTEFAELAEGESIAIDGTCFTVTDPQENRFAVDVSPETLAHTVAGTYEPGDRVNLERALAFGDRLGGHVVSGHVDHTAHLAVKRTVGDYVELRFHGVPEEARRFLFAKGSVCVQGVSLTVNAVDDDGFTVMVIPHTAARTTIGELAEGASVNIEHDWLAKLFLNAYERGRPSAETNLSQH